MDHLTANVYNSFKYALRKVIRNIENEELFWNEFPVILIDFNEWQTFYFENENDAIDHLQENNTNCDEGPPDGEDQELVIIKFCDQKSKETFAKVYKDYKFFREINGVKFYREQSFVEFEPELIINVCI